MEEGSQEALVEKAVVAAKDQAGALEARAGHRQYPALVLLGPRRLMGQVEGKLSLYLLGNCLLVVTREEGRGLKLRAQSKAELDWCHLALLSVCPGLTEAAIPDSRLEVLQAVDSPFSFGHWHGAASQVGEQQLIFIRASQCPALLAFPFSVSAEPYIISQVWSPGQLQSTRGCHDDCRLPIELYEYHIQITFRQYDRLISHRGHQFKLLIFANVFELYDTISL